MLPLSDKVILIQELCLFLLDFVPLVFLTVIALQGKMTFSILPLSKKVEKPSLFRFFSNSDEVPFITDSQVSYPENCLPHRQTVHIEESSQQEDIHEKSTKVIEAKAMRLVCEYEKRNGRNVEDVSMYYTGYDYKSHGPGGFRAIEVKGKGASGNVFITANEWQTAKELGKSYFLYIVENISTEKPRLKIIQNPYNKLNAKVNKTQFILSRQVFVQSSEIVTLLGQLEGSC